MTVALPLYNAEGKSAGKLDAPENIFGKEMNQPLVQANLVWFLASQRAGTHNTKTRAEVRGGGIKPWKQKGTGRARAGSIRSPLWRKGGVVFGPKPRDYSFALPKKMRKQALKIALSDKVRDGKLQIIEEFKVKEPKTKLAQSLINALGISGKSLFILENENSEFNRAAKNISGVKLIGLSGLNIFDILDAEWVVIEKAVILKMQEVMV
jgi:large subunit ribosomal protein L4